MYFALFQSMFCLFSQFALYQVPIELSMDSFPWDAQVHHHVQPWMDAPVISVSGVCIIMMSKNTSDEITSGHVPIQPNSTHARTHMKIP